jgi:hypothetical protein
MAGDVPPRDGAVRWAKWKARFERDADGKLPQGSSELTAQVLKEPAVAARIQQSFDGIHGMETEVRQVLNEAGVPTILYVYYLDFGRELWKLTNRISGESAKAEATILRDKWDARGLAPEVLNTVSLNVFGLTLPALP